MEWPKAVFWNRCSFVIYMDKLNSIAKKNSSNTNLFLDQKEIRLIRYGRHIFIRGVKKIGVE